MFFLNLKHYCYVLLLIFCSCKPNKELNTDNNSTCHEFYVKQKGLIFETRKNNIDKAVIDYFKWKNADGSWNVADYTDENIDLSDFHNCIDTCFHEKMEGVLVSKNDYVIVIRKGGFGTYTEVTYLKKDGDFLQLVWEETTSKELITKDAILKFFCERNVMKEVVYQIY